MNLVKEGLGGCFIMATQVNPAYRQCYLYFSIACRSTWQLFSALSPPVQSEKTLTSSDFWDVTTSNFTVRGTIVTAMGRRLVEIRGEINKLLGDTVQCTGLEQLSSCRQLRLTRLCECLRISEYSLGAIWMFYMQLPECA